MIYEYFACKVLTNNTGVLDLIFSKIIIETISYPCEPPSEGWENVSLAR